MRRPPALLIPGLLTALAAAPALATAPSPARSLAGAVVLSDQWLVRRAQGEEEFIGHVRFDQGADHARAGWAWYSKPRDLWRARGSLYLWHVEEDGSVWDAWGQRGWYRPGRREGEMSDPGSVVRFRRRFRDKLGPEEWLGNAGLVRYDGNADLVYLEKGTALDAGAVKVRARAGIYRVDVHRADFVGGRPIALFSDAKLSAAVQADTLSVFDQDKRLSAAGSVHGWFHLKHNPKAKPLKPGKKKRRK